MLVEDDESVRTMLTYLFKTQDYRLIEADSYEMAVALLQEESIKPDLILSDINLIDKSGYDLVESVRETSLIPIILTSGNSDDITEKTIQTYPYVYFIPKPYTPVDIIRTIDTVFEYMSGSKLV